jgi:hypothetical protein
MNCVWVSSMGCALKLNFRDVPIEGIVADLSTRLRVELKFLFVQSGDCPHDTALGKASAD